MRIIRSFTTSLAAMFTALSLALSGCANFPLDIKRTAIDAFAGITGAAVCYKFVGGGNMKIVSGAACGVGAALLADWLQQGTKPSEADRITGEYQRALSDLSNSTAFIDTKNAQGDLRITLSIDPLEYYAPSTQCRSFTEYTTRNGVAYTPPGAAQDRQSRRACRDLEKGAWTPWRIFVA